MLPPGVYDVYSNPRGNETRFRDPLDQLSAKETPALIPFYSHLALQNLLPLYVKKISRKAGDHGQIRPLREVSRAVSFVEIR